MSLPVVYGSNEPDPKDFDEIVSSLGDMQVTEPFAESFMGNVEAIDFEMKRLLVQKAIEGTFTSSQFILSKSLGNTAIRHDPDIARWN